MTGTHYHVQKSLKMMEYNITWTVYLTIYGITSVRIVRSSLHRPCSFCCAVNNTVLHVHTY